jgi:acetyltransferase-like isoleucine patch superfamily enzyme
MNDDLKPTGFGDGSTWVHEETTTVIIGGDGKMPQVAPNSNLASTGEVHESVVIHRFCEVVGNVDIGEGTVIGSHCTILGDVKIGKNVRVQSQCFIPSGTVIEDNAFLAPNVIILNDKFPPSKGKHWRPVHIGKGASIGGAVTILPGVTIAEGVSIGAGSNVTKSIELPHSLAFGNPAQIKGAKQSGDEV